MYQEQRRFAPVREGDEMDVRIEAVGEKGDGIAKKQGFVLFIPKTKTGDEVRIRVTKVLKNAGFAEVIGSPSAPRQPTPAERKKKEEEDFQVNTENDSEDFGDEPEAEEIAEKSDDDFDENSEEENEK